MADIYKSQFTGQQVEDILSKASNAPNIEANPSGEASEVLTKITIGDKTYSIPEGAEGTVVEGNPTGEATVELTKLKIGDIIYSIPQGGGGGGKSIHNIIVVQSVVQGKIWRGGIVYIDNNPEPITIDNAESRLSSGGVYPSGVGYVRVNVSTGSNPFYPILNIKWERGITITYFNPAYTPLFAPSDTITISNITSVIDTVI